MTLNELIHNVTSMDGVWVKFKQIADELVLIFWKEESPIASIYATANKYSVDYPKLFEMELEQILLLNNCLYNFSQTDLAERKLHHK